MEDKNKDDVELARLAVDMYPSLMKALDVWKVIVLKIAFMVSALFSALLLLAMCKALWWVTFVWKF